MTRAELLARCERHCRPMRAAPSVAAPMAPSERELAHLEAVLDSEPMSEAAASLLWLRIAAMAAVLDYGA